MPQIDLIMNARQFNAEAKKAGDSVEKISDSLDDVARDGDKAADKLERSFRDIASDAKKAETAVGDAGDGAKKGFGRAGDAAGEFKAEALSNFSEVTSSFDGSMSSIQDLAQGTLGGLASTGLPGIGLAAGGAAIAVGLIGAAIEDNNEKLALSEQAVADWADKFIESGERVVTASQIAGEVVAIATDPERYKAAAQSAKDWGVDESTALRALAGDSTALTVVQQTLTEKQEAYRESIKGVIREGDGYVASQGTLTRSQIQARDEVARGTAAWEKLTGEMQSGHDRARSVSDALHSLIDTSATATKEVDELGNELYTLPDQTQILVDAETGQATMDVGRFQGDLDGLAETIVQPVIKPRVDSSAWDNWRPSVKNATISIGDIRTTGRAAQLG